MGVADLVLEESDTQGLVVIDHKTASLSSMQRKLDSRKRQLYIYAAYARERFGRYPKLLRFNLLRDGVFVDEPFDPGKLKETEQWVDDAIRTIQSDSVFAATPSSYFCRYICGVSGHCPLSDNASMGGQHAKLSPPQPLLELDPHRQCSGQ